MGRRHADYQAGFVKGFKGFLSALFRRDWTKCVICAVLVTLIFAVRWRNCLPFSGYMPVIGDWDTLSIYGRFLLYAKEPFGYPVALIKNLEFPFQIANMSQCSMFLFPLLFKLLSPLFASLSVLYYFVSAELICMFAAACFAWLLLKELGVASSWYRLFGVILITLSPALLFRSSHYYDISFMITYFPVFLAWAYYALRVHHQWRIRDGAPLAFLLPVALLLDNYLALGVLILSGVCLFLELLVWMRERSRVQARRFVVFVCAFLIGGLLTAGVSHVIGYYEVLEADSNAWPRLMEGRYRDGWGYGGGLGNGFHVADVLSFMIPPASENGVPLHKQGGPAALLTQWGFPLTTAGLQDGQYEGFAYAGSVVLLLLALLLLAEVLMLLRKGREKLLLVRWRWASDHYVSGAFLNGTVIVALCALFLYVVSWGYIVHVGGHRLNWLVTPSLIMSVISPKLVFARSLGRLAPAFTLVVIVFVVVWLWRRIGPWVAQGKKGLKIGLVSILLVALMGVHLHEVWGYLVPKTVVKGNPIIDLFGEADVASLHSALQGQKAIITVPTFREDLEWTGKCYSLAYHSGLPISGPSISNMAYSQAQLKRFNDDLALVKSGKLRELLQRYPHIAIAASAQQVEGLLRVSNVPLINRTFPRQGLSILVEEEKR